VVFKPTGDGVAAPFGTAADAAGAATMTQGVARALPLDADVIALGEHRLRGVPTAMPLFQLGEGAFPPARQRGAQGPRGPASASR
jgi:hypothetical protein